jgi:hypothetical protein
LHLAQRQVLTSLRNHWQGLIVFVTYPEVPMDNNRAEQAIRNSVTGRKNYYGSGSVWSAELAAMMFSLFQTIEIRQLITDHPEYHRADLSRQVCRMLQGYKPDGGLKEMSCRVAMWRMQAGGFTNHRGHLGYRSAQAHNAIRAISGAIIAA